MGRAIHLVGRENLIQVLDAGADEWNAYRVDHPGGVVLRAVQLKRAQLSHADLHGAFLPRSDFQSANLSSANLEAAVLREANLQGSDLRSAKMDGADLYSADLSGADLREASLTAAFLKRANICGADLSTAHGLTPSQIAETVGDQHTRLPENLSRAASWNNGSTD